MNVLIDINHPAHVHYFRNLYKILIAEGHHITVVSRNKEIEQELLKKYSIPFLNRGRGSFSLIGKVFYHFYAVFFLIKVMRKNKIECVLSFMHPYGAQAAWLLRKKSILFSDTENANLHHMLSVPFATEVHTPSCFENEIGKKHFRFNSFMELSYLHPNYFKPENKVLNGLDIDPDKPITVIRFVKWGAVHDIGHQGISISDKIELVKRISEISNVLITSESKLPDEISRFSVTIDKSEMHNLLYFSDLFFGESATMASESAMLGTPAIYIDNEGRGYTNFLEKKYGIVYNFKESKKNIQKAIEKGIEILEERKSYNNIRDEILKDSLDTTMYMKEKILK